MAKRILHVVTNVSHYDNSEHKTGLWLTELTHAWEVFEQHGFEQVIASPEGGAVPLEPKSLKFPNVDKGAKQWLENADKKSLLENTVALESVDTAEFDAVYFTGGHATMYDFTEHKEVQRVAREMWESKKVVSAVCHGYCALLNVELSSGRYLIKGKRLTGFSWLEERLAGVSKIVPYNAESLAKERGALYQKGLMPFSANVVVDGKLVTGQNPGSALVTATKVAAILARK